MRHTHSHTHTHTHTHVRRWVGFMFCRRKSYKDLRIDRDTPDGIEVP